MVIHNLSFCFFLKFFFFFSFCSMFSTPPSPTCSPIGSPSVSLSESPPRSLQPLSPHPDLPMFSSLLGLRSVKLSLFTNILLPLSKPPYVKLPVVLLYGPPGTGKSSLCRCVAGELGGCGVVWSRASASSFRFLYSLGWCGGMSEGVCGDKTRCCAAMTRVP